MRIEHDTKLDFDDVLIRPKRSRLVSRKDVDLVRTYKFVHSKQSWSGIPIIATNMDTVGTIEAARALEKFNAFTWLHRFNDNIDIANAQLKPDNYAISYGEDCPSLFNVFVPKYIRIDVANGYRQTFVDTIKRVREHNTDITIFAGNVCTPEITEELILAGTDIVVIGIGSGGHCTTRLKSGIGYPQLSAIIECADAAHGLGGHIVSDGGCRTAGDVVKAFAAGADFVALGSMLAAHQQNSDPKNFVEHYPFDRRSVRVYGMSSKTALDKYYGGVKNYRAAEGKETLIPFRGDIANTMTDIIGGIRSACSYVGAIKLKELSKRTTFVVVNRQHNTYYDQHNAESKNTV